MVGVGVKLRRTQNKRQNVGSWSKKTIKNITKKMKKRKKKVYPTPENNNRKKVTLHCGS